MSIWSSNILFGSFLERVIFITLFRHCPTLWNQILKMKILKMLFSSFLTFVINNFELENVDLTLFDVVNSNLHIQRCFNVNLRNPTSQRHINLRAMLKWRWNNCWASFKFLVCFQRILYATPPLIFKN